MNQFLDRHSLGIKEITPALATFIIGLLLSIGVFYSLHKVQYLEFKRDFELNAQQRLSALQNSLLRHREIVASITGLFSASEHVTRQEFRSFVEHAIQEYPDIQALGWNPLIRHDELEAYAERARKDGFSDFKFNLFSI